MATCHCDGPPHTYDPSWCGVGRGDDGRPIARATGESVLSLPVYTAQVPPNFSPTIIVVNNPAPDARRKGRHVAE